MASGNVPDMSTALPAQVVEIMDADALIPIDDLIDEIGRSRFAEGSFKKEGKKMENVILYLYILILMLCG